MQINRNTVGQGEESTVMQLLKRTLELADKQTMDRCKQDEQWQDLYWLLKQVYGRKL